MARGVPTDDAVDGVPVGRMGLVTVHDGQVGDHCLHTVLGDLARKLQDEERTVLRPCGLERQDSLSPARGVQDAAGARSLLVTLPECEEDQGKMQIHHQRRGCGRVTPGRGQQCPGRQGWPLSPGNERMNQGKPPGRAQMGSGWTPAPRGPRAPWVARLEIGGGAEPPAGPAQHRAETVTVLGGEAGRPQGTALTRTMGWPASKQGPGLSSES